VTGGRAVANSVKSNNVNANDVMAASKHPDTKKDVSLDYLKEKMRERAETEVPRNDAKDSSTQDSAVQKSSVLETKLDETKEAVEKVTQKLEELSEQVRHDQETSQNKTSQDKK
jgi:uncharacterized coiled-coil protein SlyX